MEAVVSSSTVTQRLEELDKYYQNHITGFEQAVNVDMGTFSKEVDARYNSLEFPKDSTTPDKSAVQKEGNDFTKRYHSFCYLQEKMNRVYQALKGSLAELKQVSDPKMKHDVQLGTDFETFDFASHIAKIDAQIRNVELLRNRMTLVMPQAESSLGYFLQIVSNDGKPISNLQRMSTGFWGTKIGPKASYSGVLSSIFDGFSNSVNKIVQDAIDKAEQAGDSLIEDAARSIYIAIENAKNAYKDSLNLTVDKVSKATLLSLDAINSMIQKLQSKNAELISQIASQSQELVNTLPCANRQPQLIDVLNRNVAVSKDPRDIHLLLSVNYMDAARSDYAPTCSLNDNSCASAEKETARVGFMAPSTFIKDPAQTKNSFNIAKVQFPWDDGWIFSHTTIAEFQIYIGVLPLSPGKFTAEFDKKNEVPERGHKASEIVKEWGDSDSGKGWVTRKHSFLPDSGWKVDISTITDPILEKGAEGSHYQWISKRTPDEVEATVSLDTEDGKHMGRIQYHVEFDQTRTNTVVSKDQKEIPMGWGDSKVIESDDPNDEFSKLTVKLFDGTSVEFAGSDSDNPYVKVENQNGKFVLKTTIPKDTV